jgi:hypothetical protein
MITFRRSSIATRSCSSSRKFVRHRTAGRERVSATSVGADARALSVMSQRTAAVRTTAGRLRFSSKPSSTRCRSSTFVSGYGPRLPVSAS